MTPPVDTTATPLGKCLMFYFTYQPEMLRLYWKEEKPDDLTDPETLRMIKAVGDKSCEEAGDFLDACGKIIETHFKSIARCTLDKKSKTTWTVSYGVWPQSKNKPHGGKWRMQAGVDISRTRAQIIPWLYARGKSLAEDRMMTELAPYSPIRAAQADLKSGKIALAQIPIPFDTASSFTLDRAPLLDRIHEAFTKISQLNFENIHLFANTQPG